jgi:hypothetical protein
LRNNSLAEKISEVPSEYANSAEFIDKISRQTVTVGKKALSSRQEFSRNAQEKQ